RAQLVIDFLDPRLLHPPPLARVVDIAFVAQVVDDLGGIKRQESGVPVATDMCRGTKEMIIDSWARVARRLPIAGEIWTEMKVAARPLQGPSNAEIQIFVRAPVIFQERPCVH